MPNLLSAATLNAIIAFGILLFGVAYLVQQIRAGSHKSDKDLIKEATEQLQAQKEIIGSMQRQIETLTAEVNHLKGLNEANEQKIKEYLQIITNRNPDLDKTLATIAGLVAEVMPFMKEMKESHQYLREKLDALQPTHRTVRRTVSEVRDAA
jgi:uncharacterized coiled-coil protein SlyX